MSDSDADDAVFIGYRRSDSQGFAGRLADDLVEYFGEAQIFRDDEIRLGSDFPEVLNAALAACEVFVLVIGPHWLIDLNGRAHRRLDRPDDWVRREIEAALARNIWVMPILVGGAEMPPVEQLPPTLHAITRVQAAEISDRDWEADLQHLVQMLATRIPLLRNSERYQQHLASGSAIHEAFLDKIRRMVRVQSTPLRSRKSSLRKSIIRLVTRLIALGLFGLVVWFVFETYAGPQAHEVLNKFIAFVVSKYQLLIN